MPTMDEFKRVARTVSSPDEVEDLLIKTYGELPDELLDPLKLAEVRNEAKGNTATEGTSVATAHTIIDAHLSNFQQAYEGRLPNAKAVGFQRNIEGQGLPGTQQWVEQQVKKEDHKPTPEVPPTTKG